MSSFLSNKYLQIALRIIIGGIFIYAAANKLFNPDGFAKAIHNYEILPLSLINIIAIIIPWIELFAGVFMLSGIYKRGSSLIILLSLAVFVVALSSALARGLNIDCGCFSLEITSSKSDISIRIIEDILIFAGTLVIFLFSEKKELNNNLNGDTQNEEFYPNQNS